MIGLGDSESTTTRSQLEFYSSESASINQPVVELTYNWTPNNFTEPIELEEPVGGQGVWNISGHNFSGNQTPSLIWNSSSTPLNEIIIQVATDPKFRNIVQSNDSRVNDIIFVGDGSFTFAQDSPLPKGQMYFWRLSNIDTFGRLSDWSYGSFLVSSLTSTYDALEDRHEIDLQLGSEALTDNLPACQDASISSQFPTSNNYGSPYISPYYSVSQGETVSLLQCNLFNYLLPPGYAVESSYITLDLINAIQSPEIGVWEGLNHDWNVEEVTWNQIDSSTSWSQPGANGLDRGSLLDTSVVSSSSNLVEWNITYATQNAMRNLEPLDLIFAVIPSGVYDERAFFASNFNSQANKPTLKIVYIPGSNELPSQPAPISPSNGEFLFADEFFLSPNPSPNFEWIHNSSAPVNGWSLEVDTVDTFDTSNLRSFNSWNDAGFDIGNNTFSIPNSQNGLDLGEEYHWRVRALSNTNQLGDWSQSSTFAVPNLSINQLSDDRFSVALEHLEVLSNRQLPLFIDTYLVDSPQANFQANHSSETTMQVGTTNIGSNASSLLRISIDNELMPINSRLVDAKLSLYSTSASSTGESVAVRQVFPPWSDAATIDTYDGTNNWAELSGRGIGTDIGLIVDIQSSINGWMEWNITEIAQDAIIKGQTSVSIMLYNVNNIADRMVYFSSTESQSNRPILELTWANGSVTPSPLYPQNTNPSNDQIVFDTTSHAIVADTKPIFKWNFTGHNPSPDAWRICIDYDVTDELAGFVVYDSRVTPQHFDLINFHFTPPVSIDFGEKISWRVQPIYQDVLGLYSNKSYYFIPQDVSSELSQTTAELYIQDGSIVKEINYPQVTTDIYLDEGLPNQLTDSNGLSIGNSSYLNTNYSSSTSLIGFNLSSLSLPNNYEIISANLELTTISGSGQVYISASEMLTEWSEMSTWNQPSSNKQWIENGALRGDDSENPDSYTLVSNQGTHSWNVTRIVQHSIFAGSKDISILLQPELIFDGTGIVEGNYFFADSENSNIAIRPKLNLIYSTDNSWIPPSPISLTPADNASIWNEYSPLPSTPDHINFQINSGTTNETSWNICRGNDKRWLFCDSTYGLPPSYSWDSVNRIFNYSDSQDILNNVGDKWQYWRVRADQGHRLGDYSEIQRYRVSPDVGFSDGSGNYTIQFYENSIFDFTGSVPVVNDASVDSIDLTNTGTDSLINIGYNFQSGGISYAFYEFDISGVQFPQSAIPTSLVLQLSTQSRSINANPITISAHECDSFDETKINYSSMPSCSANEITRTTITGLDGDTVEWDLTGLGQRNFQANNFTK